MFIDHNILKLLNAYHMKLTPDEVSKLLDLLRQGDKIAAIILIRQESGLGLKDAKDLADSLQALTRNE
jgi:ribosomal protein L7/L12